jgi:uncharacterized surface protein with fasciclin (FAS1) repeats
MKKIIHFAVPKPLFLKTLALSTLTLFMFSCQTEDMDVPIQEANSVALFEILDANTDGKSNKVSNSRQGAPQKGDESIAAIAIGNGSFNELVDALLYVDEELNAGLVDLFLNGKDQYTVFAPVDSAFFNLYNALDPNGGIDSIRDLPADLVLNVLLYHVTEGRRASNSVVPKNNSKTIETLLGSTFSVNSSGMITGGSSNATILAADISASNGIIHVIDAVLLP